MEGIIEASSLWPVAAAPFIGSFLGVLVMRLPQARPVILGTSSCDHCGRRLGAADLVPIASWLAAGGRCRHCGAGLSPLYLATELGALGLAVWAASLSQGWALWVTCCLGWDLLALALIDWREGLLPDALTLPLVPLGLLAAYLADPDSVWPHAWGALLGFAAFAAIRSAYRWLRGREGLGFGDVKLLAGAGAFVSWQGLPSVVLIAAVFSLALALAASRGEGLALDRRLAFGPGICLGTWLIWLYGWLG
ncbi:MAG: prepilin peptidase [Stellaceae bacterium]